MAAIDLLGKSKDSAQSSYEKLSSGYLPLLADYEAKLMASKASPEDPDLAFRAYEALQKLKEAEDSGQGAFALQEAQNALSDASRRLEDMQMLADALSNVDEALKSSQNGFTQGAVLGKHLVAMSAQRETRPFSLAEAALLMDESRLISADSFLRFGDITTQLGATEITEAYIRQDGKAFVLIMKHGAKADIATKIRYPDQEAEDNALNGARFSLQFDSPPVFATNNSPAALLDLKGIDLASADYAPVPHSKSLFANGGSIQTLDLEDALGFDPDALGATP
jgi:hypothetical protein